MISIPTFPCISVQMVFNSKNNGEWKWLVAWGSRPGRASCTVRPTEAGARRSILLQGKIGSVQWGLVWVTMFHYMIILENIMYNFLCHKGLLNPFYILSYYIDWVEPSWTYIYRYIVDTRQPLFSLFLSLTNIGFVSSSTSSEKEEVYNRWQLTEFKLYRNMLSTYLYFSGSCSRHAGVT